ncbi:MAG TPA: YfhO family protein, partial [Saprospiraceae bacterium]|nr:YfhO family protein [Saprospiraceae bacterium]
SAGLIWTYWSGKIGRNILLGGFAVLVLFDMWSAGRRYLDSEDFTDRTNYEAQFKPTPADEMIFKDSDPNFRVYDRSDPQSNPFASSRASYFHKSIGGYHAAKLQRYQDLIDRHLTKGNISVFNMLNTKYFIMSDEDGTPSLQPNVDACGHAWFVSNINMVKDANAEIAALETFVPEEDAFVHQEFESYVKGFKPEKDGEITLESYSPNRLEYKTKASSEQFAVFSEIWYGPGSSWKAYIDGQSVEHIRANYLLRAMRIPAGEHKVEFVFDPDVYRTGKMISTICSSIVLFGFLGLLGFLGYQSVNRWNKEEAQKPVRREAPAAPKPAATMRKKGKK